MVLTKKYKPVILLVSATAGFGHVKAGCDLAKKLEVRLPGYSIEHENLFEFASPMQKFVFEKGWKIFSCWPGLRTIYSIIHKLLVSSDIAANILRPIYRRIGVEFEKKYWARDLRAIIALHPGAAAVGVHLKNTRKNIFLGVVATDLVVHSFQSYSEVDVIYADELAYLASHNARNASRLGKIIKTGLPVRSNSNAKTSMSSIIEKKVLVSFGAQGMRAEHSIDQILHTARHMTGVRFLFLCGKNQMLLRKLRQRIEDEELNNSISALGFREDVEKLISHCAIVVGKPGGITIGEVIAQSKPFVVIDYLPGQEEYNIKALMKSGIGHLAETSEELLFIIQVYIGNKNATNVVPFYSRRVGGIDAIANSIESNVLLRNEDTADKSSENIAFAD